MHRTHAIIGSDLISIIFMRNETMSKQIHVRLDDSLFQAFSEYAERSGLSVNDFISSSIMQALSNQMQNPSVKKRSLHS